MFRRLGRRRLLIFLFAVMGFFIVSCGSKAVKPVNEMDTPERHFDAGMRFLDQKKYADAKREFYRATALNPKYSKPYTGNGLVSAYQGDFKAANRFMKQAGKFAQTDEEKFFIHLSRIKLYTLSKPGRDWIKEAKSEFDKAIAIDSQSPAVYYFMGLAYKTELDFANAGQMFRQVIDINSDYVKEANVEWNLIQKIQKAMPETTVGKKIALLERINKADAAALFMEELKIGVLYKKKDIKTFDMSLKGEKKAKAKALAAADISNNPLKADIEGIIRVGVRGLEAYPDGLFHPNDMVDRATYAMMIEDILIKGSGDNSLATKFVGSASPFPDLRPDLPYFNAAMLVTSKGIMEAKDTSSGEFGPFDPLPGVDALLIIRKLKEELKIF